VLDSESEAALNENNEVAILNLKKMLKKKGNFGQPSS
jgi:hypothetical protein